MFKMKSLYNCLIICWSTALILTLISPSIVPSVNAGGSRRKVGGHNGLDRRGRQKLPIRPEDQSTSSRGRGRGSRKKASGTYYLFIYLLQNVGVIRTIARIWNVASLHKLYLIELVIKTMIEIPIFLFMSDYCEAGNRVNLQKKFTV